jgi:permuted papain-like amidase YaeF/Yiix C92 family enzyme
MRKHAAVAIVLVGCWLTTKAAPEIRPGDIVFQTSLSSQSQAIQLATHSPYSHMGMVLFRSGRPFVLEAAGQVQLTALEEWASRGQGGTYVIKRLKDPSILASASRLARLTEAALAFVGRPYDPYFEWSDDHIYCSELVWKAYDRGLGIQLGDLAKLSTFDLSNEVVKRKLVERYGGKVPMNEQVISPASMFSSPLLETVR